VGIVLLVSTSFNLKAQESYGPLNSNYSPTNSVHLNVTSMLDAKTWLDINIVGVGTYLNNNFLAAEETTNIRIIKDLIQNDFGEENRFYNQDKGKYHLYNRTFLQLPSVTLNSGNHAVGLSFGGYSYTSVHNYNDPIAHFVENGVSFYSEQHLNDYALKNFRATSIAYGEGKISYANTFLKKRKDMFMLGISYKKIFPLAGIAANVRNLEYRINNDSTMDIANFEGDVMNSTQPQFSMKGGWGIDLGFTYQKMERPCRSYYPNSKRGGCNRNYYKYKIGVSINDVGFAKFNPDNINYQAYSLSLTDFTYNTYDASLSESNLPSFLDDLETTGTGVVKTPHKVSLPTYLSVQYDLKLYKTFLYLNATWVQSIPHRTNTFSIRRANSIAITPRFETKLLDFSLPFSLYEYNKPQLGASLRFYALTIGTDKLLNYFIKSNIYGADIYFYLKVPLFKNPKCKNKGGAFAGAKRKKRRGVREIPCDAYR
jgi:hypothetical protein